MRTYIDLIGQKFGKWTVLEKTDKKVKSRAIYWLCQCECGKIKEICGADLRAGKTTQCKNCASIKKDKNVRQRKHYPSIQIGDKFGKLTILYQISKIPNLWQCKCECGNETKVRIDNLHSGKTQSCGCIKSRGEEIISQILLKNKINFIHEYSFNDLKGLGNGKLRFDFAIFDNNNTLIKLIEFQGRQHYEPQNTSWNDVTKHDELKREYCKIHNIPFLEIPYKLINKITLDYLLN